MNEKLTQIYYKNNRLQQIRGFCHAVRMKNVTKAAIEMNISQSAVSIQIKSLERDLNTKLIKRKKTNSKNFELTEDGRKLYEMSLPILARVDNLYDRFFLSSSSYNEDYIRIASHHSVLSLLLPENIKYAKKINEKLQVKLSYLSKKDALEELENKSIDLAIYPLENIDDMPRNFNIKKVADYKPALIMQKNHPLSKINNEHITFELIGKYNFIHTGKYAISEIMNQMIENKTLDSYIELNYGSWDIIKALVVADLGVTIFHRDYCRDDKNIVVKDVHHLSPNIAYYAITNKGQKEKKIIKFIIESMINKNINK